MIQTNIVREMDECLDLLIDKQQIVGMYQGSSEIGPGNVILGPNPSAHSPSRGAFTITTVANSTGPAL